MKQKVEINRWFVMGIRPLGSSGSDFAAKYAGVESGVHSLESLFEIFHTATIASSRLKAVPVVSQCSRINYTRVTVKDHTLSYTFERK